MRIGQTEACSAQRRSMRERRLCPRAASVIFALWLLLGIGSGGRTAEVADCPARDAAGVRMIVVPAAPVSDRTRVEIRIGLENNSSAPRQYDVQFFVDRPETTTQIGRQTVAVPAQGRALARCWWETRGQAGKHQLVCRAKTGGQATERLWPVEVIASDAPGLSFFQGAWLEPIGVLLSCEVARPEETEANVRASVDAMCRLGMDMIVLAYVEYQGMFFYPSQIEFYDREVKRQSRGRDCHFDMVETVLSQADKHGKHVFLGLGRGGDLWLLWEFEKPGWKKRNEEAVALSTRVARDLWQRYGHHPSFYGWYLTHEMGDLAKASAYYNPVANFCHSLVPEKPVLTGPADVPVMTKKTLQESSVDIFAYQDSVGAGYVPGKYTYRPDNRIAMLDEVYARYRGFHDGTDKHFWADLEIWEMDGSQGYGGAFPAAFERVKRQIEIERKYTPVLTAYAWHLYLHDPACRGNKIDPRAVQLFQSYSAWKAQHAPKREKQ
jgi:hypothetical protein